MNKPLPNAPARTTDEPGTLGALLYADAARPRAAEADWVALVRAVAAGDQSALRALYERAHRLVFTLAFRISGSRETAEELTVDTFHGIWQRASAYDPVNGTVLGWIMNQARSRAIDRLRFDQRQKRAQPSTADASDPAASRDAGAAAEQASDGRLLLAALESLTPDERQAIETAFFGDNTYGEVATQLGLPLGTVKTRVRAGLRKLRAAIKGTET